MGRKNNSKTRKKKQHTPKNINFLPESGKGCHIIRPNHKLPTEILGWENIDPEDYEDEEHIPDICFDPNEDNTSSTLTLCNTSPKTKVAYVTIYEVNCYGKYGKLFQKGITIDNNGCASNVVTFILLSPPMTFCTLCEMTLSNHDTIDTITSIRIESDVQEYKPHPNPSLEYKTPLGFPLQADKVLCTQGRNGQLTHYFLGNFHAVDFQCEVGTPVLSAEDGEIIQVKEGNTLTTGISALNLFEWNSILVRHHHHEMEQVFYTEYVHIQSSIVKVGDKVKRGDRIGSSGSVGFSPEPHLHFGVFFSEEEDAESVGFWFEGGGTPFQPVAGTWYNSYGPFL